jgi:hypothetical protein
MPTGSRRWATTLAVAFAVAAVVVGAGYGLQRSVLRAPGPGEIAAAEIDGWIAQYHFVRSEIHVPGRPVVRGECLEGWQPAVNGRPAGRGARVLLSNGERLVLGDRRIARIRAARVPLGLLPVAELELAGCGRALTNHIYGRLVGVHRARAVPDTFRGAHVLRVHVRTHRSRFDLLVTRRDRRYVPVGIRVSTRTGSGWSALRPVLLTPERKRAFLARFDG